MINYLEISFFVQNVYLRIFFSEFVTRLVRWVFSIYHVLVVLPLQLKIYFAIATSATSWVKAASGIAKCDVTR